MARNIFDKLVGVMAKIPDSQRKKEVNYRRNVSVNPPTLVSGLNVKGADGFLIVNFLDGINNLDENALISSYALPNEVAKTLMLSIEKHFETISEISDK